MQPCSVITVQVPLIVFDSFAGVGAFRPVAQVPNEADEQKISSRTMYSEEQRALLEDAFHRVRFPSWEEKSRLAERLGVTEEAVRTFVVALLESTAPSGLDLVPESKEQGEEGAFWWQQHQGRNGGRSVSGT